VIMCGRYLSLVLCAKNLFYLGSRLQLVTEFNKARHGSGLFRLLIN
jgi:hypothetical protein